MDPRPNNAPKARFLNEAGRPNSLGLHHSELTELLDQLDIPDGPRKSIKRDFARWPFRRAAVPIKITHPNGTMATLSVACRNISRGGMAILHSAFLHPGTRCSITLPHPTKGMIQLEGWVARCTHRLGMIHEIGVTFAEPVDVRELLRPDPLADCFSMEKIDQERLQGSVLCVEASEADQKIVRHFLRGTPLKVECVYTPTQALERMSKGFELIILDLSLPEIGGPGLVLALRDRGFGGPIIVTTSDTSAHIRKSLPSIEANAFLPKPLGQTVLLRAVAEFLIAGRNTAATVSTLGHDHPDYPMAEGFALSLRHTAKKLEDTIRRDDPAGCKALCQQLAATAPGLGFQRLGEQAANAANMLTRSMSIADSIKLVRSVIAMCERAKARRAA
jgi:two-component system, chemotaxis family, chemotaxis protein CheY